MHDINTAMNTSQRVLIIVLKGCGRENVRIVTNEGCEVRGANQVAFTALRGQCRRYHTISLNFLEANGQNEWYLTCTRQG